VNDEKKAEIDAMSYEQLLRLNRFEPIGSPWFQGYVGTYLMLRMAELRGAPGGQAEHVRASKAIGWG
jgi:hypothetical protein